MAIGVSLNDFAHRTGPVPGLVHPMPMHFAAVSRDDRMAMARESFHSNQIAAERARVEVGGAPGRKA